MSIVIISQFVVSEFFNLCVLIFEIIRDFTGLGYEAAKILIFE